LPFELPLVAEAVERLVQFRQGQRERAAIRSKN
jgi:hypothetical protein